MVSRGQKENQIKVGNGNRTLTNDDVGSIFLLQYHAKADEMLDNNLPLEHAPVCGLESCTGMGTWAVLALRYPDWKKDKFPCILVTHDEGDTMYHIGKTIKGIPVYRFDGDRPYLDTYAEYGQLVGQLRKAGL